MGAFSHFEHYQPLKRVLQSPLSPIHSPWLLELCWVSLGSTSLHWRQGESSSQGTYLTRGTTLLIPHLCLPHCFQTHNQNQLPEALGVKEKKSNLREKDLHTKRMAIFCQFINLWKFNKLHLAIINLGNLCRNGFWEKGETWFQLTLCRAAV